MSNEEVLRMYKELAETKAESQRYAKHYVERVLGIYDAKALRLQHAAGAELSAIVASLSRSKVDRLGSEGKALAAGVQELLDAAAAEPSRARVGEVVQRADRLTARAESLLVNLQKLSPAAKPVALAAKAMHLSQRVARDYYLFSAGYPLDKGGESVAAQRNEVVLILDQLAATPLTSKGIKNGLELAKNQWTVAGSALSSKTGAEDVARASERMFEILDDVLIEYQKIVASLY